MSYFSDLYNKICYRYSEDNTQLGLRNAQIGAIHTIAAYYTLNSNDRTAIIVMPTGSGKSSVIMVCPYILQAKRVLIVTPSALVRSQIANDYKELFTLKKLQVIDKEQKNPIVYEMCHLFDDNCISEISRSDVIVATPQAALSLSESEWAKNNIDLVEVDEAHHSPAKTWQQIIINTVSARHILYTATPYRMDKKEIKGDIIYNYPLSKAYMDGIFGEIKFIPVEEINGISNDICIAKKAEEVFLKDRQYGFEHYIMARANTKSRGGELEDIYKKNTNLRMKRIDSSMTSKRIDEVIIMLKEGKLDGVICVDMLGEGFDFPNLKIAAIHDPHKSLAYTLQFIGRFARTNADNIGMAKFLAVPDEELAIENKKLYASDACWQEMIIDLSEGTNTREENKKKFFRRFETTSDTDLDTVPIQSINLSGHARIYSVDSFDVDACFPQECNVDSRIYRNKSDNTVIGIGVIYDSPRWLKSEFKINKEYVLYIVHYQKDTGYMFIYSHQHSEIMYESISNSFATGCRKIDRSSVHRVLGGMEKFEIFNTGLANMYNHTGESYRISAGSDVGNSIDPLTGRMFTAGHVFCKAVDHSGGENSEKTIGYSSGSKIWTSQYMDIPGYINWCDENGNKIINSKISVKTNTGYDNLPQAERLMKYPNNIFMADYNYKVYIDLPIVYIEEITRPIDLTDIDIRDVKVVNDKLVFVLSYDKYQAHYMCDIEGKYRYLSGDRLNIQIGREKVSIEKFFDEYPIEFRTTDYRIIVGYEITSANEGIKVYDNSQIVNIDWKLYNTNIKKEIKDDTNKDGKKSIQETIEEILLADSENEYVIYDHGNGEIADYISVKKDDMKQYIVSLYHAKAMNGSEYNNSVNDVYEVCGQAVKSLMWFKNRATLIDKIYNRNLHGHCIMKRGNLSELIKVLKNSTFRVMGKIYIVQPGLSKSRTMSDKVQEVLAAASTYISYSGNVIDMGVWGSD